MYARLAQVYNYEDVALLFCIRLRLIYIYVECMYIFGCTGTRMHARTQARGVTPELQRIAGTGGHPSRGGKTT